MKTLSPKQIENAQKLIDGRPSGEYEVKQLYASRWKSIRNPWSFGKLFKATVQAGKLQNIRLKSLKPLKTNNHHTYVVGA